MLTISDFFIFLFSCLLSLVDSPCLPLACLLIFASSLMHYYCPLLFAIEFCYDVCLHVTFAKRPYLSPFLNMVMKNIHTHKKFFEEKKLNITVRPMVGFKFFVSWFHHKSRIFQPVLLRSHIIN